MIVPTSTKRLRATASCTRGDLEGVKRVDEEVGRGQGAENGGQEPGPEAAEVRGDHDGREEGHVQDPVPQHRPEVQMDQQQYQGSVTAGASKARP